jgi:hypothetical protein
VHVEPGMPLQPVLDPRMFVGGLIVGNDADVEFGGTLLIDPFEKGEPFLMTRLPRRRPGARRQAGDQLAFEIIERGEQEPAPDEGRGQGAAPHVIMGLGANVPDAQGQARLRALDRLALRFLVAAQHPPLLRRVEIEIVPQGLV